MQRDKLTTFQTTNRRTPYSCAAPCSKIAQPFPLTTKLRSRIQQTQTFSAHGPTFGHFHHCLAQLLTPYYNPVKPQLARPPLNPSILLGY